MIEWIRGILFDLSEYNTVGHMFRYKDKIISLKHCAKGHYPPFDCIVLTLAHAKLIRNWLDEIIKEEENDNRAVDSDTGTITRMRDTECVIFD